MQLIIDKATLIVTEHKESFGTLKRGLFLCSFLLINNGLIEIYRGGQGRVAMATIIYGTKPSFEFLSMLFE